MKLTKALLLCFILQSLAGICFGQQNLVYNHYFINPYLYNPSYLGSNGYTELNLNYRQSWVGVEGAPKTATLNFQLPINHKMGVGTNLYYDQYGIYKTTTGYLSFAYQIHFGQNFSRINRLGFGLSAGYTNSKIDLTKVSNPDDPAYTYTGVSGLQGQFGINYQLQNFKIGFALPRLLRPKMVTNVAADSSYSPFHSTIATVSYNFHLSPRVSIEPYLLYRTEKNMPSQYEVMGVLRIDNVGWVGAAYRQEYGASAFFGLNLKEKMKIGYAYEFAPNQVSGLGKGSHEVQLILRLGKKKKERPQPNIEKVADVVEEPEEQEEKQETINEPQAETQPEKEEPVVVQQQPIEETKPVEKPAEEIKEKIVTQNPTPETEEAKPEKKAVAKTLDGKALEPGHYVVVGAFRSVQNAKTYSSTLRKAGYPAHVAFNPDKGYYIVHMGVTPSMDEAQRLRDVYRQKSRYSFKDTWILTIP